MAEDEEMETKPKKGKLISADADHSNWELAAKMLGLGSLRGFLTCNVQPMKPSPFSVHLDPHKLGPTPEFHLALPPNRSVGILPEFAFRYKAIQLLEYAMQLAEGDIDPNDGFPTAKWYGRAAQLIVAHDATLKYNWTGTRNIIREIRTTRVVKAYWWIDRQLSIPEFRKRVFYPLYCELVRDTQDFKKLKAAHESGHNIVIISPGARPFMDIQKHFNSRKPMGSATLLCAAVMGIEPIDRDQRVKVE
jgi:hypothetical protein